MTSLLVFYKLYQEKYQLNLRLLITLFIINLLSFYSFDFRTYLVISLLLVSSIIDIKEKIVPNIIPVLIIILSIRFEIPKFTYLDILTVFVLLILTILSYIKDSIGMGDVKLFISIYIFQGAFLFNYFLFALSFLMFFTSIFILLKNRNKNHSFPLVPLILLAFIISRSII